MIPVDSFFDELEKIAQAADHKKSLSTLGTFVGGAGGALAGGLIGRKYGKPAKGALLGGMLGAPVGYGLGYGAGALAEGGDKMEAEKEQNRKVLAEILVKNMEADRRRRR